MLTGIFRRRWIELEQLDLEARLGSFERKRDVLSLHIRHAHVSRRRTAVDRQDVLLPEAEELEELDRGRSVRHREGYMIGIADRRHHLPPLLVDRTDNGAFCYPSSLTLEFP